jgi:transposase
MYQQQYWHGDETGIAVLDSQVKKDTHQGYYWTYLTGDGRLI